MRYNRKNVLFDLSIVDVDNDQITQNEISLGRWIVDALTLLLSLGESCDLVKAEKDFQTREDMLADFGLNVIWYKGNDEHRELPKLLKLYLTK